MKIHQPDPIRGGYSDIRLWPCYIALSIGVLAAAPFIGLFMATVLVGAPIFLISIKISGVGKTDATIPRQWLVYWQIEFEEERFNEQNRLLRKQMAIRQSDEREMKKANEVLGALPNVGR